MRISLKLEYACRVLGQLARFYGSGKLVHIEQIANAEEIPQNYLVQILNELRNGGLITSKRGKQGGYALIKLPEHVTLIEVIRAVDADLLGPSCSRVGESGSEVAEAWEGVSRMLAARLAAVTVRDFLPASETMYYI